MKKVIIIVLVLVTLVFSSVVIGASYSKQITAWFYDIDIVLNGQKMLLSKQPFIYEGTTYVPLRDIGENLNCTVIWDDDTKTAYMFSNDERTNNYYPYNTLGTEDKDLDEVLKDKYDEYTEGSYDLEFEYDIKEYSSYIRVKMEGQDFDKDTSRWSRRDDDDFEDFVEDVCKEISDEYEKDVKIYVYDENHDSAAKYEYDESRDDLETKFEEDEDYDEEDVEDDLNDDYDEYTGGDDDLEFEYNIHEYSSKIKIYMEGKNFKDHDSEWDDRDDDEFRDFVEEIAEEVSDKLDEDDIEIYVKDEDNHKAAEYEYDADDNDLEVISED